VTINHCSPEVAAKVVYEFTMFRYAYAKLEHLEVDLGNILPGDVMPRVGTGISTDEVRDASVILESFLLHTRVLRDFFCRPGKKPDDVFASDFVNGWVVPSPLNYSYVAEQEDWLNKSLAHLTTARVKHAAEGKQWDVATIKKEIDPIIDRFLAALPPERKSWFTDRGDAGQS
jgi:hypothetical protein